MTTYAERLRDPTFDTYQANHASVIEKFSLRTPVPAEAGELVAAITSGEHPHLAFAALTQLHGKITVTCLYRLFRYPGCLGRPTPWDNYIFGLLGDVVAHQFPLVYAGEELFAPIGPVHVPTLATMDEALQNWELHGGPGEFIVGPLITSDQAPLNPGDTDVVHVRRVTYLPPHLAAILIQRDLSPLQVWRELGGHILATGIAGAYADILAWLRSANVWKGADAQAPMEVLPAPLLPPPRFVAPLTRAIAEYTATIIAQDLGTTINTPLPAHQPRSNHHIGCSGPSPPHFLALHQRTTPR